MGIRLAKWYGHCDWLEDNPNCWCLFPIAIWNASNIIHFSCKTRTRPTHQIFKKVSQFFMEVLFLLSHMRPTWWQRVCDGLWKSVRINLTFLHQHIVSFVNRVLCVHIYPSLVECCLINIIKLIYKPANGEQNVWRHSKMCAYR